MNAVRTVFIEKQVTNFVMLLSIKIDVENTPSCAREVPEPWEPCNEKKNKRSYGKEIKSWDRRI